MKKQRESTATPESKLLTPSEAATALRVSRPTIYRLVKTGVLAGVRIGGSVRVHSSAVAALVDAPLAREVKQ